MRAAVGIDAHVIVDVNGWFGGTTGIQYGAGTKRIADRATGSADGPERSPPARPGTSFRGPITVGPPGCGARHHLDGVERAGFITVQPCGDQAEVSNLNFVGGVDITNLAVVPLADDGADCVTASDRTHIVVDVFGGFGDGRLAAELSSVDDDVPGVLADQHDYIAYCNGPPTSCRCTPRDAPNEGGDGLPADRRWSTPRS